MAFPDSVDPKVDGLQENTYYIQANNSVTPDSNGNVVNNIPVGKQTICVSAITNDQNDFVVLPTLSEVPNGYQIMLINSGIKFGIQTPATSNAKINNIDCDGSNQFRVEDNLVIRITKINNTAGWVAEAFTALGAVQTAIVPDQVSSSASPSASPSSSVSKSVSPSASVSASVSPSSSVSASDSPSTSPSSSPSPSSSESASASPSVSPSASVSPSSSVSASASPSASLSPSASVSPSASISPSA